MFSKNHLTKQVENNILRHSLGIWLKEIREGAGLSQRQLADILEFEYYTFISQIENGKGRIPSNKYIAYAEAVSISKEEFVKKLIRCYEPVAYSVLFPENEIIK
jgi:transcriptional regulator with XRE-family HTH domain